MPKLRSLIQVGFCEGYQDGDFRVSMEVQDLSRERIQELKAMLISAGACAEDMWKRGHMDKAVAKAGLVDHGDD